MSEIKEILVPDIGDFKNVEIIEVQVNKGDLLQKEDTLITLESDKASIDIPSPESGTVASVVVRVGDKVSEGSKILSLQSSDNSIKADQEKITEKSKTIATEKQADISTEVVVLGSGPGGYTAAFRSADLGKKTILIERYNNLGGVCLNVGCIPSKAMLHIAKVINEVNELKEQGIDFSSPNVDKQAVRQFATKIIAQLTGGLKIMAQKRKVDVMFGNGKFISPNMLEVEGEKGRTKISFENAIIAAGSQPATIPGLPDDPRIMDSTDTLLLSDIPKRLLVVGGGIIGLEMATIYDALGSKITVVEMLDTLIGGCDADIVRPLQRRITKRYENIYLSTAVAGVKANKQSIKVSFDGKKAPDSENFDAILISVGRQPNGLKIGAENAEVNVDERGFIAVDDQQRTNQPHIFAIGDIIGNPMLAHKATHEGKVAAEVIAGLKSSFDNRCIPSVAYTDPEIAWVGITENQAKEKGIDYGKGTFPWAASGRSLSLGRNEGMTKIIFDKTDNRIIGAGIVGPNAGDLIAECTLAIEMGLRCRRYQPHYPSSSDII